MEGVGQERLIGNNAEDYAERTLNVMFGIISSEGKHAFCIIVVEITYLLGKLAKHTTTSQDRNIVPIKVNDIQSISEL